MSLTRRIATAILTLVLAAWSGAALADTAEAMCEMRKDGETKQGATGPCTFSQRQGYVSIDLRNGDRIELSPTGRPDHFKDQKGKSVVLTVSGNSNEYKWDGKKLIVRWTAGSGASSGSGHGSGHGDTPHALRDLVGARAGSAEEQVRERGYTYRNTETSGNTKYSNWRENSTGRCVLIRTEDGRYAAISYVTEIDCEKGGSGHGGGGNSHVDGQWDPIPCRFTGERKTCHASTSFSQAGTGIEVKFPDGFVRKFVYDGGNFRSNDGLRWTSRKQGGTYYVSNDNQEEFEIPAGWFR
ncbi:MAG: hypothetical protein MUF27_12625 [Acidobacteria bacterium]|jgi:hypothetical protein|nr:hypothetical protein [Acidobacteriota bacterium]